MPSTAYRLVLDTNVIVRAFVTISSASGRVLQACEQRRVVPLLSRRLLAEYRDVLKRPALLQRFPELERPEVDV